MSTAGIQNYLSNVFRPIYTYDATTTLFTPKLELVNLDTVSANVISVFTASIGDSASNVYVGSNAGNPFTTIRACSNVTALGYGAGSNISNTSNSVFIGWYAGANESNTSNSIAIGKSSGGTDGANNICIGTDTGVIDGDRNILLGHFLDLSDTSDQVRIGYSNQIPIAADLSTNWVGIGGVLTPSNINFATVDISGSTRIQGNVGINIAPGTRTLDVNGNFRARDASLNALDFSNGFTRSTGGFVSIQNGINVNAVATTIGTLKKGVVLVSAVNQSNSADYASRMVLAYTTSDVIDIGSNVAGGDASITFSTSNIQITDTTNTTTYDYNITYFPLI